MVIFFGVCQPCQSSIYGKHLLQQQKDKLEKIKDLAEATEERRKNEEKEKNKRDWEQQLKEVDDCLNDIEAKKVQYNAK